MDDAIKPITQLIEKRVGINIDAIGEANFLKIINEKMHGLGITNPRFYFIHLMESKDAFQDLVEKLLVPETWFFRDANVFSFLETYVFKEMIPKILLKGRINFLSVACSSGEEPYSIAIQMLETGLKEDQFSIDAIDISKLILKKAKEGVYSTYSFRGLEADDRRIINYFDTFEDHGLFFKVKKNVKRCVNFLWGNILEDTGLLKENYYDFIFCKNLLIYMLPHSQHKLLTNLNKMLLKGGILLVAPAEVEYLKKSDYRYLPFPKAYAFQKIEIKKSIQTPPIKKTVVSHVKKTFPLPASLPFKLESADKGNLLLKAKQYADSGEFDEASRICKEFIFEKGPHAEAFFLLGLIAHALDKYSEAEDYFHKTIYLEKDHYEALIYLALLSEKKGETAQAKLFFNRARRVSGKTGL